MRSSLAWCLSLNSKILIVGSASASALLTTAGHFGPTKTVVSRVVDLTAVRSEARIAAKTNYVRSAISRASMGSLAHLRSTA